MRGDHGLSNISSRRSAATILGLGVALLGGVASIVEGQQGETQQEPDRPTVVDEITVIGVTPIGAGVDLAKVAASVQTMGAEAVARSRARNLSALMSRGLGGVHVVEAQGNPFQPDVHFRGYAASPLLGSPQGLSVYQDGVRLNELFGDTVHWDLIPVSAISTLALFSGSNPLFGLNTLGGSVSIRTKSGFGDRSHGLRAEAGSFGQRGVSLQSGGARGRFGYYLNGDLMSEDGWRDFSPSTVRRLFGKLSWQGESTAVDASVTAADNRLRGNGAAPIELLTIDRTAVFTHPDITDNALILGSVGARREIADGNWLEGRAYFRRNNIETLNADTADFEACAAAAPLDHLCVGEDGGVPVLDLSGNPVSLGADAVDALNNTSETRQRGYGGALETTIRAAVLQRDNQLIVGVSYDAGRTRFGSQSELAALTPDRGAEGHGIVWLDSLVHVRARNRNLGLFVTDTLTVTPGVSLTVSGRYNDTRIELFDELGDDLDGDHSFGRLNLSGGLALQASSRVSVFAGYAESSRAPTPIELTCADPENACRLPNSFVADPALEQVVTRTWEGGLRARLRSLDLRAVVFQSVNHDDILFVSSGPLRGQGFFENVGRTRRRGVELGASGRIAGGFGWHVEYMQLSPTFDTVLTVASPNHPLAADGEIRVEPGDAIPGIPRHNLKAGLIANVGDAGELGLDLMSTSSRYFRGDEANLLAPVPGFTLLNAMGSYRVGETVTLYATVTNLLDAEYETFGVLGEPGEVFAGRFDDPRFLGPGAPRSLRVGLEWILPR